MCKLKIPKLPDQFPLATNRHNSYRDTQDVCTRRKLSVHGNNSEQKWTGDTFTWQLVAQPWWHALLSTKCIDSLIHSDSNSFRSLLQAFLSFILRVIRCRIFEKQLLLDNAQVEWKYSLLQIGEHQKTYQCSHSMVPHGRNAHNHCKSCVIGLSRYFMLQLIIILSIYRWQA